MKIDRCQLRGVLKPSRLLILIAWVASPCCGQVAGATRLPDLWTAAKRGDLEQIHDALTGGAKINAQDAHGVTPLSWAAMSGHNDAVGALVESGADVNSRNGDGATPLIGAAFFGRSEVVRTLLEHGAQVDVVNDEGEGPLVMPHWNTTHYKARALGIEVDKYQVRRGRQDSTAILREHGAVEERGSPLAFAVLVVIVGVVGGVTWLRYRGKRM